jgi:phosphohistidine phosphatase SixA
MGFAGQPEMREVMKDTARSAAMATLVGAVIMLATGVTHGQAVSVEALVKSLREGGYVLVMRHASSPREIPDKQTAHADNVKLERQLDEAGRAGATAMGKAIRDLKIPIGEVLTSPTYRALETVRLAQLAKAQSNIELGDGGQSMQGVSDAQAAWLRERVTHLPTGTNTFVVSHMPNISRAFPSWDGVADGEVVVVGPDGKGGTRQVGRIKIEEWSRLR